MAASCEGKTVSMRSDPPLCKGKCDWDQYIHHGELSLGLEAMMIDLEGGH